MVTGQVMSRGVSGVPKTVVGVLVGIKIVDLTFCVVLFVREDGN